jgi:hypothetical protein
MPGRFSVDTVDAQAAPVENVIFLWITASAVLRCSRVRRMLHARRFAGGRVTRSSQRIGYDARLVRSPLSGSLTKYDAVMAELIGEDVRRSSSRVDRSRGAHVPRPRRIQASYVFASVRAIVRACSRALGGAMTSPSVPQLSDQRTISNGSATL